MVDPSTLISGEKYGRFRVNVNSHNNEGGAYVTHVYAVDSDNNIIASDTSLSVNITKKDDNRKRSSIPTQQAADTPYRCDLPARNGECENAYMDNE